MHLARLGLFITLLCVSCVDSDELGTAEQEATGTLDIASITGGKIGTFASAGAIDFSAANPFFASLGSNGRTCGSCHLERAAWSITPAIAQQIATTTPNDPLFSPVDGSDCPLASNPNPTTASTELIQRGNIRVEIGIPATADFFLNGFFDPHNCATKPSASRLYLFRRPLPSTNLKFLPTVMWDGRESTHPTVVEDLTQQANDATLGHAQATLALTSTQSSGIVNFELPLFTAQTELTVGNETIDLTTGANGGPIYLATTVASAFFIGINDTFSTTFDKRAFSITSVGGLNGPNDASQAAITGTCTTCHDSPDVGNHSKPLAINIGVVEAASVSPAAKTLSISHLPIYTFRSSVTGAVITVTDPGRALVTGKFADIGKTKGPILRGLAAREPLFHNGSATITQLVSFYNLRFNIGLSTQDKTDLQNFLRAL